MTSERVADWRRDGVSEHLLILWLRHSTAPPIILQALAFTVFALGNEKTVPPGAAPALVGLTVFGLAAQYGPVTGCGMNPARDLGEY